MKWGQEVKAETFASRLAWAAGTSLNLCTMFGRGAFEVFGIPAVRLNTSARTVISGMRGSN